MTTSKPSQTCTAQRLSGPARQAARRVINDTHVANPATGTMDVAYDIQEGEKCYIEKIIIKGNVKTKDRVLRRELAVYPGEVYDMVLVKISKAKLEQMQYFEKVDTKAQDTDVPNHKDLVIGVEEKNTGNVTLGAGFSSVESIVGFVELKQGNFDLFNPPTFTGAGQKFEMKASDWHVAAGLRAFIYRAVVPRETTRLRRGFVPSRGRLQQP